ncbi:virulence protein RhuM/Fic/DOC family protein [Cardiobacteriaceae bacterium TAE3-ERU3]|nr:virulence protein RhuM/Fic/DOC family protein [Cardiobacteriaceae bacterium TAE3-ERU3]
MATSNDIDEQNCIQLFTSEDGEIELSVSLDEDTVWLTQAQMAMLFEVKPQNITMHLKNVFAEGELEEAATCKDFLQVQVEGGREVKRKRKHYNLDAIISVGYRVSSRRATQFRQWATRTLKQHLVEGYTLNQRRLTERGIEHEQAVSLLSRTLTNQALVSDAGEAVIAVVQDYARSWSLLQGYDEQSLGESKYTQHDMQSLELSAALQAIAQLKAALLDKNEATELFGQRRGDGLEAALASIEQGFGDVWLYPNVASRAAHLLYFIIKNHPFVDGNKRIGSFLFLCYLRSNQHLLRKPVEQLINDNTLVALALLVAESQPEQKTLMIRLIEHFIATISETKDNLH